MFDAPVSAYTVNVDRCFLIPFTHISYILCSEGELFGEDDYLRAG